MLVIPIFLVAVFAKLDRYFFKENAYFCPSCIHPRWGRCPQFETKEREGIEQILDQPFHYFSQGKQSFVFASQDGKWVIKFVRLPRYVKLANLKGKKSSLPFLEATLKSFKFCYEELFEETGIIYAHARPTTLFDQQIELTDHLGAPHSFNLDQLPFVVQHRGEDFFTTLESLSKENAKTLIRKTIDLFSTLYDKGFIDRDPILDKNFGVREGQPFILDVGQLERIDTPMTKKQYLEEMTISMHTYLSQHAPDLFVFYKNFLQ